MKSIVIFGLGRSSKWLVYELAKRSTHAKISAYDVVIPQWLGDIPNIDFYQIESIDDVKLLPAGSLVISLLPPSEHLKVAHLALMCDCNFITASYLNPEIDSLGHHYQQKGLYSIHEAGLDPGIDHITALHAIDTLHEEGYTITHFESHCGGLPALSNLNRWGYTFFWSPLNVLNAGKAGAKYLKDSQEINLDYEQVFKSSKPINLLGIGEFEFYPNRDSFAYIKPYGLPEVKTFIRGTMRYAGFGQFWQSLIDCGLTSEELLPTGSKTYEDLLSSLPNTTKKVKALFEGWHQKSLGDTQTYSEALFALLLSKLSPAPSDLDRVVMYHNIVGVKEGSRTCYQFTMDIEGTPQFSSMSQTVGLPLKLICDLFIEGVKLKSGCYTVADPQLRSLLHPMLINSGLPMHESLDYV